MKLFHILVSLIAGCVPGHCFSVLHLTPLCIVCNSPSPTVRHSELRWLCCFALTSPNPKQCLCLSQMLHHGDKVPDIINLRRGRFILAHGFRDFRLWFLASLILGLWWGWTSWRWECVEKEAVHPIADRKQRKEIWEGARAIYSPQWPTSYN
jgi:hypothetical protein